MQAEDTLGPEKVVEAIVNATAPAPTSSEERHRELEEKVVRECVRELTKGGMYFAYTFGGCPPFLPSRFSICISNQNTDLTTSRYHEVPPTQARANR
jgi:hypothetical protein